MEFSGMVPKWSSKSKDAKAARIRDNQRRHRARTKAYIDNLERQLAEVRAQLDGALIRNTGLASELKQVRTICADRYVLPGPRLVADGISPSSPVPASVTRNDECSPSSTLLLPPDDGQWHASRPTPSTAGPSLPQTPKQNLFSRDEESPSTPANVVKYSCGANSCPAPVTLTIVSSQGSVDLAALQSDCSHLPPPALGESTILCKTAYDIIEQQNYKGLDLSTATEFLTPGFRRATTHEDGCRVESTRVFAVIDAIDSGDVGVIVTQYNDKRTLDRIAAPGR